MRKIVFVICFNLLTLTLFNVNGANLIFKEDFSNRLWLAERWKIHRIKDWKAENKRLTFNAGNAFFLNQKITGDFKIEVQVAMIKDAPKGNWYFSAINVNGILFMIRKLGFATAYREPGAKRSNGTLRKADIELNRLYNVTITVRHIKNGLLCTYEVDGKLIDSFKCGIKKKQAEISLVSRGPAEFANFRVSKILNARAVSPNLIVNSSFENIQEGRPQYYDFTGERMGSVIANYGSLDNFWKCWNIDTKVKHSGKNSARIEFNDRCVKNVGLMTFRVSTDCKPAVYSLYLKANKENLPVNLIIDDTGHYTYKKIIVGAKWKRYECKLVKAKSVAVSVGVALSKPGILWVDDIQLEVGDKATAHSINNLDDSIFKTAQSKISFHPEIKLRKFDKKPVIDGNIENIWFEQGTQIVDFKIIGTLASPKNKIVTYLGCDNDNLYIAMKSFVSNVGKIKAQATVNDNGAVWADDSMELFLDPNLSKTNYYHLMLSASGHKADTFTKKGLGWNGRWKSAVKINKKDGCIDYEMRIPLADFASSNISDVWGINVGRSNTVDKDYSSLIHTNQPNAHQAALFPTLIWPQGIIKKFREKPVKSTQKLKTPLSIYTRYNYYMNEQVAVVVGETNIPDSNKLKGVIRVADKSITFKPAPKFYVEIPLSGISNGKYNVEAKIFNGKRLVATAHTALNKKLYREGATQIDHERRCLIVDGKPFLLIAPIVGELSTTDLMHRYIKTFKDAGFNAIHLIAKSWKIKHNKTMIDVTSKLGMKTLMWTVDYVFIARKNHPLKKRTMAPEKIAECYLEKDIIAWMAVDEPELYAKSSHVSSYMDQWRKAFAYHPVYMSNTYLGIPAKFAGLNTDILSIDDYLTNRPNREVSEIVKDIDIMIEAGKTKRTPVFFIGIMKGGHARELTGHEQTAQSYGCIIAGARGLSYWANEPCYPENWKALKSFAKEITSIDDVIFSLEKTSAAVISDKNVISITRVYKGKLYIISVNLKDRISKVNIALPAEFKYSSNGVVKFENRRIKVRDKSFVDTFKPHERHVYCIELK
jgi:hypothetical protein